MLEESPGTRRRSRSSAPTPPRTARRAAGRPSDELLLYVIHGVVASGRLQRQGADRRNRLRCGSARSGGCLGWPAESTLAPATRRRLQEESRERDALFWTSIASLGFTCASAIGARALRSSPGTTWKRSAASTASPTASAKSCGSTTRWRSPSKSLVDHRYPRLPSAAGVLWAVERWDRLLAQLSLVHHCRQFSGVGARAVSSCHCLDSPGPIARSFAEVPLLTPGWAWRSLGTLLTCRLAWARRLHRCAAPPHRRPQAARGRRRGDRGGDSHDRRAKATAKACSRTKPAK